MKFLIFAAPIICPFVLLGVVRLLWWCAGAPWDRPDVAAAMCLASGGVAGMAIIGAVMT